MKFSYQACPVKVYFGEPLIDVLKRELADRGETRFWIIASTRNQNLVDEISEIDNVVPVIHFSRVIQHIPHDQVQKARHSVAKLQPDVLLTIGGGSATGLVKAVGVKHPVPIWAVPTTYSGSEMTDIYGISGNGGKDVDRHPDALPEKVIYDPSLSVSMPVYLASASIMNAMAHLVEAVYNVNNNPFTYQSALHGIDLIFSGMNELSEAGKLTENINERFLLGACMGGKALYEANMALHHKAAHVLGGNFGLNHADVHSVLLPYVFNYQWNFLNEKTQSDLRIAYGADHPPLELQKISKKLGNPTSLAKIGFHINESENASKQILELHFDNPAPLDEESITKLIEQACEGKMNKV